MCKKNWSLSRDISSHASSDGLEVERKATGLWHVGIVWDSTTMSTAPLPFLWSPVLQLGKAPYGIPNHSEGPVGTVALTVESWIELGPELTILGYIKL